MFAYSHKDFFTLKVNYTHQVKVKNKWPITFPDLFLLTYRMSNKIDTKQMIYNIGIFSQKMCFSNTIKINGAFLSIIKQRDMERGVSLHNTDVSYVNV